MRPHTYDALKLFTLVARFKSLSAAAESLHLTKGALSHQIRRLEDELGFTVFQRHPKGISLTPKGAELLQAADTAFAKVEATASKLASDSGLALTVGVTTYFASRWLSPRLTSFMQLNPDIRLRIQPMVDPMNFAGERVDVAIRWGNGNWTDCHIKKLLECPAWPAGNAMVRKMVDEKGVHEAFDQLTLLRDREDSNAWSEWFLQAGLTSRERTDNLIIPDPNVRVQAVLDGQGVALNDELIADEISRKKLFPLSSIQLKNYGYFLAYEDAALQNPAVGSFVNWVMQAK